MSGFGFVGIDRNGRWFSGHKGGDDVADFVEEQFIRGAKSLRVTREEVVGEIAKSPETGQRVWWAES